MSAAQHIGKQPRVVAVLTSLDALARFTGLKVKPCHMAEIRVDYVGADRDWLPFCRSLETGGTPVIVTLRAAYEGGKWSGHEEDRLKVLEQALPYVSAVDVELKSGLALKLAGRGPQVIVSFHDFSGTPPLNELRRIAEEEFQQGDVAKISTLVNSPKDVQTLERLLTGTHPGPVCVLGMGDLGAKTRTEFPRRGSCLSYGYFDEPTAPGQPSAAALMELLS